MRAVRAIVLIGALVAATAPAARAAPAVTTGDDSGTGSLRAAIAGASPGDTIPVPALTVTLSSGELPIDKNLTITGAGARLTTIDANLTSRIFHLTATSTLNLSDLTLTEGKAVGGAGIQANLAAPTAVNATRVAFLANDATTTTGGGLQGNNQSAITLTDSLLGGNTATNGGGISSSGVLALTNTTVTGNHSTASGNASGVAAFSAQLSLVNSTVVANTTTTPTGEGIGLVAGATGTAHNSLVAANRTSGGTLVNCEGMFTSQGHNLEDASQCGFTGPGDQRDTDPQLAALANNGGPTDTMAFGTASPAFDHGENANCPAGDQRGQIRPLGAACDIGAFELVPPPVAVTGAASAISTTAATLGGTVNPWNVPATAAFDVGPTTAYGTRVATPGLAAGVGAFDQSARVTGLQPLTLYHYRLEANTSAGTSTGADASFTTAPLPDPRVTAFRFSPARFRATRVARGAAVRRRRPPPRGTTISYLLSEAARVRISLARKLPGRRVGRRCVRPTRANRARRRCTRLRVVGVLAITSGQGRTRRRFSGRVRGRKLAPGPYRAALTARTTGALHPSRLRTFSFSVATG
jgi:hypothetical protein